MPVFKNEDNGTWYVMARYVNWKGERRQKCKRGFATKKEAQEWERMFQLQNASDLDMSFEAFTELYIRDVKTRLKETYQKVISPPLQFFSAGRIQHFIIFPSICDPHCIIILLK